MAAQNSTFRSARPLGSNESMRAWTVTSIHSESTTGPFWTRTTAGPASGSGGAACRRCQDHLLLRVTARGSSEDDQVAPSWTMASQPA